ncbi:MAG TPA: ubiquinol-cytochrome c reductase iron-sulfur subunit [Nitrospirota bacterium]|nr:ubiquinol-cytochrome c reductase iron-sulfur subunit [Nitrospirota bacterium]
MKDVDETITRRDFFSLIGWGGVAATMGGSAFSFYRFYSPNVLYETQKVFKIGKLSDYPEGLSEKWKKERQIWVVRNERGLYVMISICRHLGCTPNWFQDKNAFLCPCHGSIFSIEGNVLGGPSPRLLWRAAVKIDPTDEQIIVDFNHRQDPDPMSTEQGLRVDEALREVEPFFLKV